MKKYYFFIIALFFGVNVIKAQLPSGKYSDYFREGVFLLGEENYDMALKNFLEAYKLDSTSANINFNVGFCYLNSTGNKSLAERYLAKSITKISKNYNIDSPTEKSAPPLAHFYYGKALHVNYQFDEAMVQYDLFEKQYANDKKTKEDVVYFKEQTIYAKELVAAPINVKIENLGDSINTSYPEYSPVLSADEATLIYTTRRNTNVGGDRTPDGQFYEDVVVSYKNNNGKWSSPKSIGQFVNSNGHEGSINLTPDGQTLILYRDLENGNVYYSSWDGKDWSAPSSFGSDVNSKYWESHACLSADNNTLYFVSDRPGGFGGRDIYRCVKLPNGAWSKATNVGPTVNTKYDEDGPFIHPDGVTLIFASNGHKSMGGFDIFFTTIEEDKKFSEPVNMGYPINTPGDDVFFVTSPDGKRGYFSSAKEGGFGEKDIYTMFIPDAKEKPLALFKGLIVPAEGEKLPDELEIVVTNKETGEIVGRYKPKENGTFATILTPNKNYNFSYQSKGQEFYNEDVFVSNDIAYQEIKKEINLDPVNLLGGVKSRDKAYVLNTIVLNNAKDKQPVPNAKVTLKDKDGAPVEFNVDAKGKKEGTELALDKQYTLIAELNGKKSSENAFNTVGLKSGKVINQILYLDDASIASNNDKGNKGDKGGKGKGKNGNNGSDSGNDGGSDAANNGNGKAIDVSCGSPVRFKQNFGYNVNEIDEKNDWEILINGIVSKTKECNPLVKIMSSASQVPTRKFSSNKELAESRADKMEEKIKAAVSAKGGDASKIEFKKISSVRGPVYATDYKNKKKYGPFQYVRVIAR
jgi:hypothetical protein